MSAPKPKRRRSQRWWASRERGAQRQRFLAGMTTSESEALRGPGLTAEQREALARGETVMTEHGVWRFR